MPDVELQRDLRAGVRALCQSFPDTYWRELDARRAYPEEFVKALTAAGYLAALIPEEYGGSGLGVSEAAIILEELEDDRRWTAAFAANPGKLADLASRAAEQMQAGQVRKAGFDEL